MPKPLPMSERSFFKLDWFHREEKDWKRHSTHGDKESAMRAYHILKSQEPSQKWRVRQEVHQDYFIAEYTPGQDEKSA